MEPVMERKVFKYSVPMDHQWHEINMPPSVEKILNADCQQNTDSVQFWVEVTVWPELQREDHPHCPRKFKVFPTGATIPEGCLHRGTVMAMGGVFVWHLYEDIKDEE